MYGKIFASTFTGSMYGAGANIFAVWGYIIANAKGGKIELNPIMLSNILGMAVADVDSVLISLSSPDLSSRNSDENGRRIVREGQFQWRVVSHALYRGMRDSDEQRAYNANAQRKSRARKKSDVNTECQSGSIGVNRGQSSSIHTEAEAEAEAYIPPTPRGGVCDRLKALWHPSRVGNARHVEKECVKALESVSASVLVLCAEAYLDTVPDMRYQRTLARWLRDRSWEPFVKTLGIPDPITADMVGPDPVGVL